MVKRVERENMPTWIATTCEKESLESRVWSLESEGQSLQSAIRNPQSALPKGGFTLLELSVVLFIIGLLVTIALPRLGDLSGARLESSARRLAALVRYLGGEAAFSGRLYRLH